MAPAELTTTEIGLRDKIQERLSEILRLIDRSSARQGEYKVEMLMECASWALDLHLKLESRGINVKHHKYMLRNRGVSPKIPEFYRNIHAIQDLLKFVANTSANDDPIDQTVDHEFEFSVFSRRWGHVDQYSVKRTYTGWDFRHLEGGPCDKGGRPHLYELLNHDSINFPEELPGYLEWLWEQAQENGLSHPEVQAALTVLAEWVNLCEKNSPSGVFSGFK